MLDILSEECHCSRHSAPVGGDNVAGGRPPPRKKIAVQASHPLPGRLGVVVKQAKKFATGRPVVTSNKVSVCVCVCVCVSTCMCVCMSTCVCV